jgi:hypothetical protein
MKKNFYVVVSYDSINIGGGGIMDKIFKKNTTTSLKISDVDFKRFKDELVERANTVASGLGSMGIRCVQLNTEEIIELFYKIYNPEMADKARFEDVENIDSSVVIDKKEVGATVMPEPKKAEEEVLIDNGSLVEEQQKAKVEINSRDDDKDAEKQIVKEGAKSQNHLPADASHQAMQAGEIGITVQGPQVSNSTTTTPPVNNTVTPVDSNAVNTPPVQSNTPPTQTNPQSNPPVNNVPPQI